MEKQHQTAANILESILNGILSKESKQFKMSLQHKLFEDAHRKGKNLFPIHLPFPHVSI